MYVKIANGQVEKYPYTIGQLRKDNPNTSFPKVPSTASLADFGVVPVVDPGQPAHDIYSQSVDEFPPAYNSSTQQWERMWAVRDATAQERADRLSNLADQISKATQNRLDEFAQTRGYDNILSACTYASSPTTTFATEGQYCVSQRDATWSKLYEIMGDVEAGVRGIPGGYDEIEPELPDLIWPVS